METNNEIVRQIIVVEEKCKTFTYHRNPSFSDVNDRFTINELIEAHSLLSDIVTRISPENSIYQSNAISILKNPIMNDKQRLFTDIIALFGFLQALKTAYSEGLHGSIKELIHINLFNDLLDASEYLLQEGWKDAAAVMIGGLLEDHLIKLSQKNNIQLSKDEKFQKKSSQLNDELAKSNVYSKGDHKSINAWLDIRNNAAHGKHSEYTKEQVELMLLGIRDFISRKPA